MGKENKIERMISAEELPGFLRKMASAIENGATDEDAYLASIEGFEKLKMNIRNEQGQTVIKIKAKPSKEFSIAPETPEAASGDPSTQARPKYSSLKKKMRKSFKVIFKTLHSGELPPAEVVQEFIDDSQLMVTYVDKGLGDEYYEEYIALCAAFQKAFAEGDVEKTHAACDELNHMKTRCHAKYD